MGWAVNFTDVSLEKKAEFLTNFLRIPHSEIEIQKGFRETLSFIVGGLYVCEKYSYTSQNADFILKENGIIDPRPKKSTETPHKDITIEHTVPIKLTVDYLLQFKEDELSVEKLIHILEKVVGTSLITKDENLKLNKMDLRSKLPDGIVIEDIINGKAEHSCRYTAAGIELVPAIK